MNRFLIFFAALFLVLIGCSSDDSSSPSTTPLSGTWTALSFDDVEQDGGIVWKFEGTQIKMTMGPFSFEGTYTYDETTTPKQLTLRINNTEPNPNYAIYRFTDTSLVIKVMDGADSRATDFTIEDNYDLFEFRKN